MKTQQVNILGSEYKIIFVESQEEKKKSFNHLIGCDGITLSNSRLILINAFEDSVIPYSELEGGNSGLDYAIKRVLRHEILHAYLNECGLRCCTSEFHDAWSRNEEMVDWFAVLSPKIFKTYEELGILS